MARREELQLDIEVKGAKEAVRDVDKIADSLEDVEDASEKARSALLQMAQASDAELRDAAAAADALAQALGPELTSKMDVQQVVLDLERMGVTFDEIRGDADQFAATLKQVDDIRLQQVNDGLEGTRTKLDGMRASGDQTRSVFANMVGNTTQDLGALGGVAGSAGVLVGQLAEQAAEGSISLANLAALAGPMAALAAGIAVVQGQMKNMAETKAFDAEQVKNFTEAINEAGAGVDAIEASLRETEDISARLQQQNPLGSFLNRKETVDAVGALDEFGVTLNDLIPLFDQLTTVSREGSEAFDLIKQSLTALGVPASEVERLTFILMEQMQNYDTAVAESSASTRFFASTLDSANTSFKDFLATQTAIDAAWNNIIVDMQQGGIETDLAAAAFNYLHTQLGLTEDQITEMAQQKLDEQMQAEADAAQAAAEATAALNDELRLAAATFDDAASRADAFGRALEDVNEASQLEEFAEISSVRGPLDDLTGALRELHDAGVDFAATDFIPDTWDEVSNMPEELRPVVDAFAQLREGIQSEMTEAFEHGGRNELVQWATDMRQGVVDEIHAMGLGVDEEAALIRQTLEALGLTDAQIDLVIRTSGAEQAQQIIDQILGVADVPIDVQLRIIAALQSDNPLEAIQILVGELQAQGIEIPTTLLPVLDQIEEAITGVEDEDHTVSFIADDGGTVDEFAGDADAAAEERNPQFVVPKSDSLGQMEELLNAVARDRIVQFISKADNAGTINAILDYVARFREQHTYATVDARNAMHTLDILDDPREVHLHVVTHQHSTGGSTGGAGPSPEAESFGVGPTAMTTATPTAATTSSISPITQIPFTPAPAFNPTINIHAGVLGNHFDIERTVARALRRYQRINGRRG